MMDVMMEMCWMVMDVHLCVRLRIIGNAVYSVHY
jgi:hypothetical protein